MTNQTRRQFGTDSSNLQYVKPGRASFCKAYHATVVKL